VDDAPAEQPDESPHPEPHEVPAGEPLGDPFAEEPDSLETLTGLFLASDLAREVQNVYYEHAGAGVGAGYATQAVFEAFRNLLTDPNEGPVIFMAIAAIQLRARNVLEPIRDAALALIESGDAQRAWRQFDAGVNRQRKLALEAIAALLREG
jgi:hypothetical protein